MADPHPREALRAWIEGAPYARALGVRLDDAGEGHVRLLLPFAESNANPGKALHGGCAASLASIGAQGVARNALGTESGPWHCAGLQVSYLAAALGEDVVADARLLRRGKEACFVEVDVATSGGKVYTGQVRRVRQVRGHGPVPAPAARRQPTPRTRPQPPPPLLS